MVLVLGLSEFCLFGWVDVVEIVCVGNSRLSDFNSSYLKAGDMHHEQHVSGGQEALLYTPGTRLGHLNPERPGLGGEQRPAS
jgi:hypothetical protein